MAILRAGSRENFLVGDEKDRQFQGDERSAHFPGRKRNQILYRFQDYRKSMRQPRGGSPGHRRKC